MSKKIDNTECAQLVIDAAILTDSIADKYGMAVHVDRKWNKAHRVHKKSLQRFQRRTSVYNAVFDTVLDASTKMIAKCDRDGMLELDIFSYRLRHPIANHRHRRT